jgi:hypothetical protein
VHSAITAFVIEKSSRISASCTMSGMRIRMTKSKEVSSLNSRFPITRSASMRNT